MEGGSRPSEEETQLFDNGEGDHGGYHNEFWDRRGGSAGQGVVHGIRKQVVIDSAYAFVRKCYRDMTYQ